MRYHLAPMSADRAAQVVRWAYPPPYDTYDMTGATAEDLLDPDAGFFAVLEGEELVAFRSYGADGRVPGWDYDDSALDTGGGMRPDLIGAGRGPGVIEAGLAHGRTLFAPAAFRVTIAAWNQRAQLVCGRLGFMEQARFAARTNGADYVVMLRPE